MTKVLNIALDDRRTGAGASGRLLHEALLQRGVDSELWVFHKTSHVCRVFAFSAKQKIPLLRAKEVAEMLQGRSAASFDVIHIHGLGMHVPVRLLPSLLGHHLLWSLDGCAPYTAGCSHTAHCNQWVADAGESCSHCPIYAAKAELQQRQAESYRIKRDIYGKLPLEFLCANDWQKEQLARSIVKGKEARVWAGLVDTEALQPGNRQLARRILGIPENAFVVLLPTDIAEAQEQVLEYVRTVLQGIRPRYRGYMVLLHQGKKPLTGEWAVDERRELGSSLAPDVLGTYYRAADLQLYFSGVDSVYRPVIEAGACALPSVIFAIGAVATVLKEDTGFVIASFDEEALSALLLEGMRTPEKLAAKGMGFYTAWQQGNALEEYLKLYTDGTAGPVLPAAEDFSAVFTSGREAVREYLLKRGQEWDEQKEDTPRQKWDKKRQRHIFMDRFCRQWLEVQDPKSLTGIWDLVDVWLAVRSPQADEEFGTQEELNVHLDFCRNLREFLVRYFQATSLTQFRKLPAPCINPLAKLWYFVFLNTMAAINRAAADFDCPQEIQTEERATGYPLIFIRSMFTPYVEQKLNMHIDHVLKTNLPPALRIVTVLWLTTAPFFGGTPAQRQAVLDSIEELNRFMIKQPEFASGGLRQLFMDKTMVSLWRLSYLGGNNIKALRAYGDYLQSLAKQQYKMYTKVIRPRHRTAGEPLRIGYISTNFRQQAVAQYMANRIKYHDKARFWVKTFYLADNDGDQMTTDIKGWSEAFERLSPTGRDAFPNIARAVRESDLDLLIYGDIGMNNVTYLLGAMRLAPVQAVLVGHGTTTGLTTIDYYVSGDHEPKNAQEHYTEHVVRLPNAGVAQLPPQQSERTLTRAEFGVPEDAVLLISCANGLKHVAERDQLLADILVKAPNAHILLKPFMSPSLADGKFNKRLAAVMDKAGVSDRLHIIPPLPHSGDLMALIKLADVQLDTYPYGGWTTNLEALYYHLPIVTQAGDLARNRWGMGLLGAMGITEGIAHDEAEYVDWAVRFAQDAELRQRVVARITEQAPKVLFNGEAAQPSYEAALLKMIEDKEKKLKKK